MTVSARPAASSTTIPSRIVRWSPSPGNAPAPSTTSTPSACYPTWETADLRAASRVRPEQAALTVVTDYNDYRVTSTNLAAWFGRAPGTPLTATSLLQGWTVRGSTATGAAGVLQLVPPSTVPVWGTVQSIALAVYRPTAAQRHLLSGGLPSTTGPMTWDAPLLPGTPAMSLGAAVADLIGTVERATGGLALDVSGLASPKPQPGYVAGGFNYAFSPAQLPKPADGCPPTGGSGGAMGLVGGLIEPRWIYDVVNGNGISFGLRPGYVVVDSENDGYDTANWYPNAAIEIP
jgi:hypothetical protein